MHPLDLIKTRFQLQTSTSAQYTGVRDCVRKMYAQVTRATDILTTATNIFLCPGGTFLLLERSSSSRSCGDSEKSLEVFHL